MRAFRLAVPLLAVLVPGIAIAQKPTLSAVGVTKPPPSASASVKVPIPPVASGAADAGAAGRFAETAAQKRRRVDYVDRTSSLIRAAVHAGNKQVTSEERETIKRHWRRAMRLFRIRDIAEDLGDGANVTRVDADIQNLDTTFYEKLKQEAQRAPVKAAATGAK